jgi:hypothetical protein
MMFSRSKSLPERVVHNAAVGAGLARLAIRQRTLHPSRPARTLKDRVMRRS